MASHAESPVSLCRVGTRQWLALGGILALGLALRVAYLRDVTHKPDFDAPAVDARFHDYWARALVSGDWSPPTDEADPLIRTSPYFRPPGYPYFLALAYALAGPAYIVPRLAQMGLGVISCVLAFLFARQWYGVAVALIWSGFLSTYWILIYFEGELLETPLLVFLLMSTLCILGLWAQKLAWPYSLLAGLVLGLAALTRPNALVFIPVIMLWVCWIAYRRRSWSKVYSAVPALILGTVVTVVPATIRNYVIARDFVLISSNGGINLFIGNNEASEGVVMQDIPGLGRFGTCFDYPALVERLEAQQGKHLKASQVSAYFTRKAIEFVRRRPLDFLALTGKKVLLFWGPREVSNNKIDACERQASSVLRNIPGNFGFVLGAAVLGIVLLVAERRANAARSAELGWIHKRWEMSVLVLVLVLAYFMSVVPFFIAGRFRVAVIPYLLLFGAYGVFRAGQLVWVRASRVAGLGAATWIVLSGLVGRSPAPINQEWAKWHCDRGTAQLTKRLLGPAVEEYRQALWFDPDYELASINLGTALAQDGKPDEAIAHYRATLQRKPALVGARYNLGLLLESQGRIDEAVAEYREILRINPQDAKTHGRLNAALSKQSTHPH